MRIAFVSDIHANLQAWKAVQTDIVAQDIDKIICLGDIVGYGPAPADVLGEVYAGVHHFVLGNHDAVVAGTLQPTGFNPYARKLIQHCQEQLGDRARAFFQKVPLTLRNSTFVCSHGSPVEPRRFAYVFEQGDAESVWARTGARLHFIGHTHRPALHELSAGGRYRQRPPGAGAVPLVPDARYVVNCGSVGMPRDGDFRASYVIYDTDEDSLRWQRVAYDLGAFTTAVREAYADPRLVKFLLSRIETREQAPIRQLVDFAPGESRLSDEVEEEREIDQIRATASRWKCFAAAVCIMLLLGTAGFLVFWSALPEPVTRTGAGSAGVTLRPGVREAHHRFLPTAAHPANRPPPEWRVSLGDSQEQKVRFTEEGLDLLSRDPGKVLEVSAPDMSLEGAGRVQCEIRGRLSGQLQGEIPALIVDFVADNGDVRRAVHREALVLDGDRLTKRYTLAEIPGEVRALRLRLRGQFSGHIRVEEMTVVASPNDLAWLKARGPLDINEAPAETLEKLPGIGETTALRIVRYRESSGGFRTVEQLLRVKGIGRKTLTRIQGHVVVGSLDRRRLR